MSLLLAQNIRVIENFGRPDYVDQTTLHPVGLAALVVCCIGLAALPRRYACIPIIAMAALIPSAQRIVLFSLDFSFLRILVLVGAARILSRGEHLGIRWNRIDACFLAWAIILYVATMIRTSGAMFVTQSGFTVDALGAYFAFRCLVRDRLGLETLARTVAILSVPVAVAFLLENATQNNVFAVFGGVNWVTKVREGRLRCMGPYNHPILAGCFWASLLPLCASRWWAGGPSRVEAVVSSCCCLIIVVCSASSTPVLGVAAGAVAAVTFLLRSHMRLLRWSILAGIVGLHLVMKAPVWHLVSRVSAVGGSTGYHRYLLIDNFIKRLPEWFLVGTDSTAHWFWGGQDMTNHFIIQGVNGGMATFAVFLVLVAFVFAGIGHLWRAWRPDPRSVALAWALGTSLFIHCACFVGISYFGQISFLWYMTLAIIAGLDPGYWPARAPARKRAPTAHSRPLSSQGSSIVRSKPLPSSTVRQRRNIYRSPGTLEGS